MIDLHKTIGRLRNAVDEAILCFVGDCYGKCIVTVIQESSLERD